MLTNQGIKTQIEKGWKPNHYLTNMSVASFQPDDWFVAPSIFPVLPVEQSTGHYYEFSKGDLARDNVRAKPLFGKVAPMLLTAQERLYKTEVDQVIVGLDQIGAIDYERSGAPGAMDPRRGKVRVVTEQLKTHLDRMFAESFFKKGVWSNEWTGVDGYEQTGKEFNKFTDVTFDPVGFFDMRMLEMMRNGRRKPNVLALGAESYMALKSSPAVMDRVRYLGEVTNPATVNTSVLAQLFGVERVVVMQSTYNAAPVGQEDMQFTCDPKGALLAYCPDAPSIDEPSAGYIIAWDIAGNGQCLAIDQYDGEPGTHTEYIEGLMSYTMKKVCDELGVYFADCV